MKLVVLSFFRNAAGGQVQRFMQRVADLAEAHRDVHVVAVYGDCVDNTAESLQAHADVRSIPLTLVSHDHGGPVYGSTEHPDRLRALSGLANAGLDAVLSLTKGACVVLYVESDLIWDAQTVLRLMDKLDKTRDADVIAPLIFAGENFYDVYAYRGLDGLRFSPQKPYHHLLHHTLLTEVSSVGSCFVMEGWVLKDSRIRNEQALPGLWQQARKLGHRVYVDPTEKVQHPV